MAISKSNGNSKRTQSAEKTKNTINTIALKLFRKYGFDRVTVDDIVKRAGVSKGAFYLYFKSKDEVLIKLFKQIDSIYEKIYVSMPKKSSAMKKLLGINKAMCEYCTKEIGIDVVKIMYANQIGMGHRTNFLSNRNRDLYKILCEIIRQGIEQKEFAKGLTEEQIVDIVSCSLRANLYEWCLHDGKEDLLEKGEQYMKYVLKGISA
ncbi:MAG: TetR/AcrR family transcriptional regulator [Clostridiales Family XIII bacterium]|jgi:AcrR family transcriptional regulator|nr:TetR/AcrR family transcriptional regulator [Clostridiales Family XIII bacterium]